MPETTKPEGLSPEVIREIEEKILGINYEDYFFSYNILYKGENMKKNNFIFNINHFYCVTNNCSKKILYKK